MADDGLDVAWRAPADGDAPAGPAILRAESLARYTSFRVGGPGEFVARPRNEDELGAALGWARARELPVRVVGGGSNLIISDEGVPGLVIVYRGEKQGISFDDQDGTIVVDAPAQMGLSRLGRICCERGWAGLDWAVGLPGTVGGAVANNAGAHGAEMVDRLAWITVMNYDGSLATHPADWLEARYRHTILRAADRHRRAPVVVVSARLHLERGDAKALSARASEHAAWRKANQPRNPCAGSIFKNPPGAFAGALIEAAGLKGRQVGGAQVSPVHANFIVNAGGATSADVAALIGHIRRAVAGRYGVELETEVEFVGAWDSAVLSPAGMKRAVDE